MIEMNLVTLVVLTFQGWREIRPSTLHFDVEFLDVRRN